MKRCKECNAVLIPLIFKQVDGYCQRCWDKKLNKSKFPECKAKAMDKMPSVVLNPADRTAKVDKVIIGDSNNNMLDTLLPLIIATEVIAMSETYEDNNIIEGSESFVANFISSEDAGPSTESCSSSDDSSSWSNDSSYDSGSSWSSD